VNRLEGKVAIVTGAARGLGEAIAEAFVAEGARVVLADVLEEEGESVAKRLGSSARFLTLDVGDEAGWEAAVDSTIAELGGLDVLVNNAAILRLGPLLDFPVSQYRELIETNQIGCFLGMRTAARAMAKAGHGSIINISSVDGMTGTPGTLAYGATKWAVRGMTKSAANELGQYGVRINGIFPGGMATGMAAPEGNAVMKAKPAAEIIGGWPLGRMAAPAEVAPLAVFLASEESSYCTGAEFVIDGGATCGPAYLDKG
jgi:3alpha(or 20beta)-hydroxysteroid dehydrogenase